MKTKAPNALAFGASLGKRRALTNDSKEYYEWDDQVIYEDPSPGNKAGGIPAPEEKSLGCVEKGGSRTVVDLLDYGDAVTKSDLSLLNGLGNDIVAVTSLFAAGVHLILFTTGRGTPVGTGVPVLKVATNHSLAERKKNRIDFDASRCLEGKNLSDELLDLILRAASGEEALNEKNGYHEISIFKDGVTL